MICVLIQVELVQLRKQTNSGTATANDDGNYKGMRQYKLPALLQKFTPTKQSCVCSDAGSYLMLVFFILKMSEISGASRHTMRKEYLFLVTPRNYSTIHRDHGGRLIPASYVLPKINQY